MKIAALVRTEDLNWSSLIRITENILHSFGSHPRFQVFNVGSQSSYFHFLDKLSQFKPDIVYFVDNRLQHPSLIRLIESYIKVPKYVFTLFGGHIHSSSESWLLLKKDLIGKDITFLCGSQCYLNFQKQFFKNKKALKHLPFPVVAPKLPPFKKRKVHETMNLLYAGRISLNKNLSPLIDWIEDSKLNVRLHIAGSADNLENNSSNSEGFLESWLQDKLKKSPRTTYHGHLRQKDLYQLMDKMDACVSLSTNLSEDFGYIMAESLLQNLPIISTEWAGYRDYYQFFPYAGVSVKVRNIHNEFILDRDDFYGALKEMISKNETLRTDLQKNHSTMRDFFSQETFKENFLNIVHDHHPFQGFTSQFKKFENSNDKVRFKALYE